MARGLTIAVLGIALLMLPATAGAQDVAATKSSNVSLLETLPDPAAISANFHGNDMYVSTSKGLSIYDISKPDAPKKLSFFPLPNFENEDVDTNGKILFISNDPSEGKGVLWVLDVHDPANPTLLASLDTGLIESYGLLPTRTGTGHTASCIQDCKYAYLAGTDQGIDIVNLLDPAHPFIAGNFKAEEATGLSSHDVQVDSTGLAWVAGYNGTAAYDTTDPLHPKLVYHTDDKGKSQYGDNPVNDGSTLNDFIHHNSNRLNWGDLANAPAGSDPRGESDVVAITEEDYNRPTCAGAGSFETWKIGADGVLHNLDAWNVEVDPTHLALCSAHYFDVRDGLVAQGWYESGTRFLDVSDPSNIRQVGYWIPAKNVTWSAYYAPTDPTGQIVYSLDVTRGIDVLKIDRGRPDTTPVPVPSSPGSSSPGGAAPASSASPNVVLRLNDRTRKIKPGARLKYSLSLHNGGRAVARAVSVTVTLPARVSPRKKTFNIGTIDAKATKRLSLPVRVSKRYALKQLEVTAAATAAGDANPRDNFAVDRNKVKLPKKTKPTPAQKTAAMSTVVAPPITPEQSRKWGYSFGLLCRVRL